MASTADGFQKGYIPESDKILVSSKLLSPNESQEIEFQAPDQPGDYPYLCTFPGHWRMMQGILTVKPRTEK
jgi:azurin